MNYCAKRKFAKRILRTEDVVARIGGDEFGILISNTGVDAVHNAIKRVRSRIQQYNKSHPDLKIKLSIGVATSRIRESLEDTSKRAIEKCMKIKAPTKEIPRIDTLLK